MARTFIRGLLLVDEFLQGNLGLGGCSLGIGRRHDFHMLASTALLAAVDNASNQKRNNKDGADDDTGFNGLGLALEPPFKLYRKTKMADLWLPK